VKNILGIVAFVIACPITLISTEPPKWAGTWVLNVAESTFGPFLMPGLPPELAIFSQTLKLEITAKSFELTGESNYRDGSGIHASHEHVSLKLDGEETVFGRVSLSFKPVDDLAFEITSKLKNSDPYLVEVSYFSVSPDGTKLSETKTQTEREVVTEGGNKTSGAVIRTATSVLVFAPQPQK